MFETWHDGDLNQIYASLWGCFSNLTVAASGTGSDFQISAERVEAVDCCSTTATVDVAVY